MGTKGFFSGAFVLILILLLACNYGNQDQQIDKTETGFRSGLTEDTACLLSQIAYCPESREQLSVYLPGWSLLWESAELNGNHAFVAGKGKEAALAIRGSLLGFSEAALQNWIYQDLHVATQENWPYAGDSVKASISTGSYNGWQNLQQLKDKTGKGLLYPLLDSLLRNGTRLLITGHSLGGNLASVYGSWLWARQQETGAGGSDHINIITFGAPAAGNADFARDFNHKFPGSLRIENEYDIVPKFPVPEGFGKLGNLFSDSLAARRITIGYRNLTLSLDKVFAFMNTGLSLLSLTTGLSPYQQTNGNGKLFKPALSGKNSSGSVGDWMNEAGFQHSIRQYAMYEKIPVLPCD